MKCTNYLVHVEDETIALETLTVADLVTLLALKEGFRTKMFEEYTVFERKLIKLYLRKRKREFFFNQKTDHSKHSCVKSHNKCSKKPSKFYTNFELEPFEFELVEETDKTGKRFKAKSFSCLRSFTNFFNDSVINFREGSIGMVIGLDNENFSRSKGLINWLPRISSEIDNRETIDCPMLFLAIVTGLRCCLIR